MATDWFDGNGNGSQVDVHDIVAAVPTKALLDIVQAGALLSMGTTSDGGALGVTVTVDGRWRREYFRDEPSLTAWLAEAVAAVEAAIPTASPSAAPPKRQRRSRSL